MAAQGMGLEDITMVAAELGTVCRIASLDNGRAVAEPVDAKETSAVLRWADERGVVVEPEGSGSKQGWIAPTATGGRPKITLRTTRMNRVLEHPWQDMTCTVEAGCTWAAMQQVLAEHGQCVALDPLWAERATVGGVIGANDSGALRLRYGALRDLVIGMTVVLADGTIARTGGKVVKNVAGYDLPKLLTGAFGTLGVITEATFRLHSIPRNKGTFTIASPTVAPLGELLKQLLESHLSLEAAQLRTVGSGFAVDVELAATPAVLAEQHVRLDAMAMELGLSVDTAEVSAWGERERVLTGATRIAALPFKATSLHLGVTPIVAHIRALGGEAVGQATGVTFGLLPSGISLEQVLALREAVEAGGGSLTLLDAGVDAVVDRWGTLPGSIALMRSVKRQFDPRNSLNPGRFLGGI